MRIVVVGCGKIGTTVVASLVAENHDVTAVDINPITVAEINDVYDVMSVCGNGADYDTLSEAEVQKADMFISVTGSDELNCLSCFLAKRMGAKNTVARIRNIEYSEDNIEFMKQQLDISLVINPEMLVAQELFNILRLPSAVNIEMFSRRNFEMVELYLKQDSALDGMSLAEIRKKYDAKFLISVVGRGDEVYIPDGSFVLKSGDRIGLTATPVQIQKALKKLAIFKKQTKSVMILGGSRTAYYLSKLLLKSGNDVKIIDKDNKKCIELSENLPEAVIIEGNGAEQELLFEEGIKNTDAFVSLTGMDEENILISCFASAQNVPKVIAKVNRGELASMAKKLGLECVVSPRRVVADIMLWYARALQNSVGSKVETLYKLMDDKVEALEFAVQPDFKYLNVMLKDIKLRKNILIAGIIRGRKAIIPTGDDFICAGDNVIVISAGGPINDLSDIVH